eukprot:gene27126-41979_t
MCRNSGPDAWDADGRSTWLDDFLGNCTHVDAFLRQALPYLDGSDDVFRYAWFTSRNQPNEQNGGSNLLPWDSLSMEPTSTGHIYAQKE